MKKSSRGTYVQIRDVVELIRSHHRRLRNAYEKKSSGDRGRPDLLLDYLSEQEGGLGSFLERYASAERETILDTWIQYSPAERLEEIFSSAEEASLDDAREVAGQAVALDRALADLYRQLEERSAAANVQRFFAGLREVAEKRAREHAESLQQAREL